MENYIFPLNYNSRSKIKIIFFEYKLNKKKLKIILWTIKSLFYFEYLKTGKNILNINNGFKKLYNKN